MIGRRLASAVGALVIAGTIVVLPACSSNTKDDIKQGVSDVSTDVKTDASKLSTDVRSLSSSLTSDGSSSSSGG